MPYREKPATAGAASRAIPLRGSRQIQRRQRRDNPITHAAAGPAARPQLAIRAELAQLFGLDNSSGASIKRSIEAVRKLLELGFCFFCCYKLNAICVLAKYGCGCRLSLTCSWSWRGHNAVVGAAGQILRRG